MLRVGAGPAPPPFDPAFDPLRVPRIRADDAELGRWRAASARDPARLYVSDGRPDRITVGREVRPADASRPAARCCRPR